jgi:3-deoxy-manno-octulosonate cytidylyltransferase (CMP-KDO synthetase)
LPAKPLLMIGGQSILEHVWRRASSAAADSVLIATDDERIRDAAVAFGADVLMTSSEHRSGSDRIAECARARGWNDDEIIVNLQGDEPLMPPSCLDQVAGLLRRDTAADAASLWWPVVDAQEVQDPNTVKVVVDAAGIALLFSRAPIPHVRDKASIRPAMNAGVVWRRHIGLYAYRVATLKRFTETPVGDLEQLEKLEQLRILEWGGKIRMARAVTLIPAGVDTRDDLERVRITLSNNIKYSS